MCQVAFTFGLYLVLSHVTGLWCGVGDFEFEQGTTLSLELVPQHKFSAALVSLSPPSQGLEFSIKFILSAFHGQAGP